eukprot:m.31183 g.31183  ORF g.31183 m.31183 type:complete len:106 (+) comp9671_c0_seq1:100-417(+)
MATALRRGALVLAQQQRISLTARSLASKAAPKSKSKSSESKPAAASSDGVSVDKLNPKYETAIADDNGYFGRSVEYTSVHDSKLQTYYDLELEMQKKRLTQPSPK